MRKLLLTTALATVGFAGAAQASLVIVETGVHNTGTFDNNAVGATSGSSSTMGVGITFTTGPQGGVVQGNKPLILAPTNDKSNYLDAFGGPGEIATVTFDHAVDGFFIYWGSVDGRYNNNNLLTINLSGGGSDSIDGKQLVALYPALIGNGTVSQWFWVSDTSGSIESFVASSSATTPPGLPHSFEFDMPVLVPEPSTWAMMGLGFAALGYAAFRRGAKARVAVS